MAKLGGFDLLAQEAADHSYREVMFLRDVGFGESPIEHLLFAALYVAIYQGGRRSSALRLIDGGNPLEKVREEMRANGGPSNTVYIEKQVLIAGWRVDFVVHYPKRDAAHDQDGLPFLSRLIVECDGHDFHERTKQQAARDRARDRIAQYEGLPILRFTGSEIWNDPLACAHEIAHFMER